MSNRVKIEDHTNLVREVGSRAILNSSCEEFRAFKNQRDQRVTQEARIKNLEERVAILESMILEIKNGEANNKN